MTLKKKSADKILDYAHIANAAWDCIKTGPQINIKKYFHLRPTSGGVTIVSTLPFAPMRGTKDIKNTEDLRKTLMSINDNWHKITQVNEANAMEFLKSKYGFKERERNKEELLEEDIQAMMINSMNNDPRFLARSLNVNGPIRFIASEFYFEQKNTRVDILGFNDNSKALYFFELKKNRTTAVEQVSNYIEYYSRPINLANLKRILKYYPINHVNDFEGKKGVMVMRFAEGALKDPFWSEKAQELDIHILFYNESISLIKVA